MATVENRGSRMCTLMLYLGPLTHSPLLLSYCLSPAAASRMVVVIVVVVSALVVVMDHTFRD